MGDPLYIPVTAARRLWTTSLWIASLATCIVNRSLDRPEDFIGEYTNLIIYIRQTIPYSETVPARQKLQWPIFHHILPTASHLHHEQSDRR